MPDAIVLSFDVEEFDIPCEYGQTLAMEEQLRIGKAGLDVVSALLQRLEVPATLFTTAHFARQHVSAIQQLAQRHEIASHGFYHSQFSEADLAQSRQTLREISGQEVAGFRMARMAPVNRTAIAQAGYLYNSSENPIWLPGRYNNLRKPRLPYMEGNLLNIPVSASPGARVPLFWLGVKNFPLALVKMEAARTLAHDGHVNFYFHPWEFVSLAGYPCLPWYVRRHSGAGMVHRLEMLVQHLRRRGEFTTFAQVLGRWRPQPPCRPGQDVVNKQA